MAVQSHYTKYYIANIGFLFRDVYIHVVGDNLNISIPRIEYEFFAVFKRVMRFGTSWIFAPSDILHFAIGEVVTGAAAYVFEVLTAFVLTVI